MNIFDDDNFADDKYDLFEEYQDKPGPFEIQNEKLGLFLNEYIDQLNTFEEKSQFQANSEVFLHTNSICYEKNMGVFDLIKGDNSTVTKFNQTFTIIINEAYKLIDYFETTVFDGIATYGFQFNNGQEKPGDAETQMGAFLQVFKQVYEMIKYCYSLVGNFIAQLNSVFNKSAPWYKTITKQTKIYYPIEALGHLLSTIYKLDCLIQQNFQIKNHWACYKRMLQGMRKELNKYNVTEKKMKLFERMLGKLNQTIIPGNCFNLILKQPFDQQNNQQQATPKLPPLKKNKELIEHFISYLKLQTQILTEQGDSQLDAQKYFNLICIYGLHKQIFEEKDDDRKLYKPIWNLQKKFPILQLHLNQCTIASTFMADYCRLQKQSSFLSSLDPKDPNQYLQSFIGQYDQSFVQLMRNYQLSFQPFALRIKSIFTSNNEFNSEKFNIHDQMIKERIDYRIKMLITGLTLAKQIKNSVMTLLLLHWRQNVQFTENQLKPLIRGIELLKAIESLFTETAIAFPSQLLYRYLTKQLWDILYQLMDKYKKSSDKRDILQSIVLFLQTIKGPHSFLRQVILTLSCDFLRVAEPQKFGEITYLLKKIDAVANWTVDLQKITDCSFLLFMKEFVPVFFQQFVTKSVFTANETKRFQYLLNSFNDPARLLSAQSLSISPKTLEQYCKHVINAFYWKFLNPISFDVEDYLRLRIHTMLIDKIATPNPLKKKEKNLKSYLFEQKLRLFQYSIDIRESVSKILNEKFYNMNAINLHDYKTYEEIYTLANEQFGLKLQDVYIPCYTLEQGVVDIITILRNINKFMSKFTYNLYTQTFFEKTKDSKQLNTIGIQQISDSIQTHGLGLINTTINQIYQFIQRKFEIVSKFLFDETIQSGVQREFRYFRSHGKYPYENAEQLNREIQRMGQFESGDGYLDKFRELIITIGNALGFARLIRSASLHFCGQHIEFLPSLGEMNFAEIARAANFSQVSQHLAKDLDDTFLQLATNFSERNDFLKLCAKNMETLLAATALRHLDCFYMIIPALTINYIKFLTVAQEKLSKNAINTDNFFTNDGFCLGISFLLRLLNQTEKYEALHWQDEVKSSFSKEFAKMQEKLNDKSKSQRLLEDVYFIVKLQVSLTEKTALMRQQEFNMMFYAIQAAKVLFRDS